MYLVPVAWRQFLGEHQYVAAVSLQAVLPASHSVHDRVLPAHPALHFADGRTALGELSAPPVLQKGWPTALPVSFGTLFP